MYYLWEGGIEMGKKTGEDLYKERFERISKAINLEEPDRTPIILDGPGFIKYGDPSAVLADYIRRPKWAEDMVLKAHDMLEEIDTPPLSGLNYRVMGAIWLSGTKLPGQELPEDALWQIHETGPMTEEDYDTIIDKGWAAVSGDILFNRLGYSPEQLAPDMDSMMQTAKRTRDMGLVGVIGGTYLPGFELLSGARFVSKFYRDLYRMPEKVAAALDIITKENDETLKSHIRATKPMTIFVGATRCAGEFINLKMFEKFAWKYIKATSDMIIDEGSRP